MDCKNILNCASFVAFVFLGFLANVQADARGPVSNTCDFFLPKMTVYIKHSMGQGVMVDVHCKSKDDDLGNHSLAEGQWYRFKFRPNLWDTTLFWCDVSWNGRRQVFNAYRQKTTYGKCLVVGCECPWNLTPDGPCFFNPKTEKHDLCEGWRG
uniref:S-protein homolog n=1 Tax=Kalanchoe fedtschenkoi TaxID=63787 RepID=A0A7N0VG25_KALFE